MSLHPSPFADGADFDGDSSYSSDVDRYAEGDDDPSAEDDAAILLENTAGRAVRTAAQAAPRSGGPAGCVEISVHECNDPTPYTFRFEADELPSEEMVRRSYARHLKEVMNQPARSCDVTIERMAFVQPDLFEKIEPSLEEALSIEPLRRACGMRP